MLPTTLAFTWTMWRQHGQALLAVAGYLIVAVLVSAVAPAYISPQIAKNVFAVLFSATLPLVAVRLLTVFTYGASNADVLGRESCFPINMCTLPVNTPLLAIYPMILGGAVTLLLWLVIALFVLRPWLTIFAELLPLWWPGTLAMAFLAWLQALLWMPFGLRGLRLILLGSLLPILIVLASFAVDSRLPEPAIAGIFGSLAVLGWSVAYHGVRLTRCGDIPDWEAIYRSLYLLFLWLPRRREPFPSASSALVWFEWRLNGNSLPIMVLLILPVAMLPLLFGKNDVLPAEQTLLGTLAIPVLVAGVAGGWRGNAGNSWVKDRFGMMPFVGALPVSTASMVGAMLKAAALTSVTSWGVMAVVVPLGIILTGRVHEALGWWEVGVRELGGVRLVVLILAVVWVLLLWTWKRKVDSLYVGLTGRIWIDALITWMTIPGYFVLMIAVAWIFKNPGHPRGIFFAVLPWCLAVVIILRLTAAAWAVREVLRRQLVRRETVARWLIAELVIAVVLFGLLAWAAPPEVPVYYLGFGVLFALPMARLAGSVLALSWNRHR